MDAAYGRSSGAGRMAATLLTLMIEPPSPATMRAPTRAVSRKGPLRLTATTLSKSSSLTSVRLGVERRHARVVDEDVDPAELGVGDVGERLDVVPVADVTRPSDRPSPEPAGLGGHLVACRLLPTDDDDVGAGRAKASTISRPRPRLPPVTRATLPSSDRQPAVEFHMVKSFPREARRPPLWSGLVVSIAMISS